MADEVEVPFGDNTTNTAIQLLAAAEELGLDPHVVQTQEGMFIVPKEVHDKAFPPKEEKKSKKKSESEEG